MDLRCDNRILHGVINEDGEIEVRCRSGKCGHRSGVIVIHKFNVVTGELVKTSVFAEPLERSNANGNRSIRSAVRSA